MTELTSVALLERPHFGNAGGTDIIQEILSWLPVKSLLRFRCVCKSWHALISSSHFVDKHCRQVVSKASESTNSTFMLFLFKIPPRIREYYWYIPWWIRAEDSSARTIEYQALKNPNSDHPIRDLDEFPDILIDSAFVGSCDGLICLLAEETVSKLGIKNWENKRILLWNPSTRKTRKLPDFDCFQFGPMFYGLGYDPTAQDYKVVLGTYHEIAVFALKTGSWRILRDFDNPYISRQGYSLNGALHWVEYCNTGARIWSFDFTTEKLRALSFISEDHPGNHGMGTVGNCLYFYNYNSPDDAITIWVMKEYGIDESWTKFVGVPLKTLPQGAYCLKPISVLEDGEILMKANQDLVLYNPKEETCRSVLAIPPICEFQIGVATYVETLVSPVTSRSLDM